ncbi:hypothetical protein CTEN210_09199 [Chaetoceros tenuissimus]|uniref:SAP domain-containing protein n=1 Tax=Chaetoceros tenuissimus TaxID=426638 RepID=A0AAD3CVG9_9STRA|nr:hypothetical protein CTEN210_09199 [Chaetoceros tenuissimus]
MIFHHSITVAAFLSAAVSVEAFSSEFLSQVKLNAPRTFPKVDRSNPALWFKNNEQDDDAPFFTLPLGGTGIKEKDAISSDAVLDIEEEETSLPNLQKFEKHIKAEIQAKMDLSTIKNRILGEPIFPVEEEVAPVEIVTDVQNVPSQFNVALAAGGFFGLLTFMLWQIPILSGLVFAATAYIGARDPTRDEDLIEGDISGPVTRTVGRATISTIEKSTPTVKKVIRAVVDQDEFDRMEKRLAELEEENEALNLNIKRRQSVDEQAKFFKVDELRSMARRSNLKVGGTKAELMLRLVENGLLNIIE